MSSSHLPTPRQHEVARMLAEYGTVEATATALGVSRVTVETTLARYHAAVCQHRIEELEAEVTELRQLVSAARTASRLEMVAERLERAVGPPSHRRVADGGSQVRDQRRGRVGSDPGRASGRPAMGG